MGKLKIGIVGTGGICNSTHMPAYEKMTDLVEIVCVCDILEDRAKAAAERMGIDKWTTDYNELLDTPGLDAIDICTPNYLHSVIAVAALNKGLHVFCEKPDAVSVAEAEKMKKAAEDNGKVLMVMRNNRYLGASTYLKKFIADGKMGDIYCARCGWRRRRGIPGKGGWFTTKEQSGGGPLIDLGVHMIDLSIWLMGNPRPVSVSGCTYQKFANSNASDSVHAKFGTAKEDGVFDVEDLSMGFIKFDNGACMQIEFSWASNIEREMRFFDLRGDKAGAYWSDVDSRLKIFTEDNGTIADYLPKVIDKIQIHEANIRHFVDVVANGAEPMFVPQQGLDMIKILEGFYKSAAEGREVIL